MANDRDQELERLEKELLTDMQEQDDLLADIPLEFLDSVPVTWDDDIFSSEDLQIKPEDLQDYDQSSAEEEKDRQEKLEEKRKERYQAVKKRDDKWVTVLMALASFLSLGIIGVLIYWLEVFFR